MIIKILGSAAAEGVPALWCECETCRQARLNAGKDIRRRTSYLIDDDTLVDFGPDAFFQTVQFNIDLTRIKRILFTHSHNDHLNAVDLEWRRRGFSIVNHKIKLFGNAKVMERIRESTGQSFETLNLETTVIAAGKVVADGDLTIIPIEAQHAEDEQSLNYVLSRNSQQILIANDTGWWRQESWDMIAKFKLDAAIIECTYGLSPNNIECRDGHMGAKASAKFRDMLKSSGAITDNTQVLVNHFSHNGLPIHKDMSRFFTPLGISVAYDGLILEI
jgi:phosphoribosyl 1,2-cyclic phosphate phosphodiesterase